jgi:hypothetical protein
MTVPDVRWIERQCTSFERMAATSESVKIAAETAQKACAEYLRSSRDTAARDQWVRTMLALQDDVGPSAMRAFIPELGSELPAGLESYSLFLIPDDRWRDTATASLWDAFLSFSRSIGDNHAGIWFLDQDNKPDVLRSQEYSRQFGLGYNDGPFVVTVRKRPDLLEPGDEVVVIRMNGISQDRVLTVLNRLSRDLRSGDISTGGLVFEEIKQRLMTLATNNPEIIIAIGKMVLPN